MTTAAPARPIPDASDADPGSDEPSRRRRVTWRSVLYTLVLVPAVIAVPVLGYKGASILRDEDTGQVVGAVTDSNEPGFEALVTPTPTQLVVMLDGAGQVAGVQTVALTAPSGGGSVVSVPVSTQLDVAFLDTETKPLDELYAIAGVGGLEQRLETVFSAGLSEVVEVSADQWAGLLQPVGPLVVENPVAFTGVRSDGTLGEAFQAGQITMAPEQVADFVLLKGEGELDTVRNDRQIAFWEAWVAAVAAAGADAVPGEVEQGLGRFVRGLAAGQSSVVAMPIDQVPIPGVPVLDSNFFLPDQPAVDELANQIIPFPVGVGRLRTRLIDGVGGVEGLKSDASRVLVAAGAEITVIGNSEEFGQPDSTVVYFRRRDRAAAQLLADAVGAELERGDSTNETVDVVVLIGRDFLDGDPTTEQPAEGIPLTPATSVPIGEETPSIAPGAPGGDPVG